MRTNHRLRFVLVFLVPGGRTSNTEKRFMRLYNLFCICFWGFSRVSKSTVVHTGCACSTRSITLVLAHLPPNKNITEYIACCPI